MIIWLSNVIIPKYPILIYSSSNVMSMGVIPMFPSLYFPRSLCSPVLCSPVSMFPSLYVPQFYVPRSLCSQVLCSPVPMFTNPYVPQYLCSPIPMFPGTYLLLVFFFGGWERGVWGVLEQFVDEIGRLAPFFQDGRHCHLRQFILVTLRQKEVCNITFPMTSRMRTLFLTPSFFISTLTKLGRG